MPLPAASALLHWLVSQSFFYVQIAPLDIHGNTTLYQIVTCGSSPAAIIPVIALGGLLVLGGVILGLHHLRFLMPLVAHCSAAISATCHPLLSSCVDHALGLIQWERSSRISLLRPRISRARMTEGLTSRRSLDWSNTGDMTAMEDIIVVP
ncbi:uncharacterized protein BDW47DRAFT_71483 [Aspergillus candidus]|uniref:Uncharacterized protein n=1 Tax=Aspergillus candidus TaxID=41067 RepID=A0A2I2F277_ASPCN|nr:hypothetical protein BDW47DRAFT_71483 [Aspergillus candidus]PLB34729.1 hypothetical protein BDW47DRAFT_71483 [Aspergillus candidus]